MNSLILFSAFLWLIGTKYSVDEVKQEYKQIFQIKVGEHPEFGPYTTTETSKLPREHFLHDFVEANYWLIHYLHSNRTREDSREDFGKLQELRDSPAALADYYHRTLVEDPGFNGSLLTLVSRHLNSRGMELAGHTDAAREMITADHLIGIAVRFFYPTQIMEDGRIKASVCAGLHGLRDFEAERDLMLEAFCYEAIFNELGSPQYGMMDEFTSILGRVRGLQLSTDKEMKLHRAQGAVWALLASNEKLRQVLSDAYESKRGILPFVVEGLEP